MSDSPIFDQMVREFQMNTGRTYADLCKTSPEPQPWSPNRPVLTRRPTTPFKPEDAATMQIPRVVPLSQKNVA
jgi:hypothetical protein